MVHLSWLLVLSAATPETAAMDQDMRLYFRGELQGAGAFGAVGAASLIGGGSLSLWQDDELAHGAAVPMFALGVVNVAVAAVLLWRTDAQVAALSAALASDPVAFRAAELDRIAGVNTAFHIIKWVEVVLMFGGGVLALVAAHTDERFLEGLGFGITLESAALFLSDHFAEARAHDYSRALEAFDAR